MYSCETAPKNNDATPTLEVQQKEVKKTPIIKNEAVKKNQEEIPAQLKMVLSKRFNYQVFTSDPERIFVSFYYESGHYSGDVAIELNADEKKEYELNAHAFLQTYSKRLSAEYPNFIKPRAIAGFSSNPAVRNARKKQNE